MGHRNPMAMLVITRGYDGHHPLGPWMETLCRLNLSLQHPKARTARIYSTSDMFYVLVVLVVYWKWFFFQFATIVLVKICFLKIRSTCSADLQSPFMFRVRVTLTSANTSHSIGALHIVAPTPWCCQIPSFLSHGKCGKMAGDPTRSSSISSIYSSISSDVHNSQTQINHGQSKSCGKCFNFFFWNLLLLSPKYFRCPDLSLEWSILKGLSWQGLVTLSRTTSSGFGGSQVAIVRLVWK